VFCDLDNSVLGVITSSEGYHSRGETHYYFGYGYFSGELYYASEARSFSAWREDFDATISRYPIDGEVLVYYDKEWPSCSSIEVEKPGFLSFFMYLFVICYFYSFYFLVVFGGAQIRGVGGI
jgi:ABC-type multidrug transport system permease subunit